MEDLQSRREYAIVLHMRKSPSQKLVEATQGKPLRDVLTELFVVRGFNYVEIGDALDVSRETVRKWVEDFGLERPSAKDLVA